MMFDREMTAFCGTYCGVCEWREKVGCRGCRAQSGRMFWGECDKARCCLEKGFAHCGECSEMPCQRLRDLFDDPEHGDRGARLRNLTSWKSGREVYEALGNAAQERAKNMGAGEPPEG